MTLWTGAQASSRAQNDRVCHGRHRIGKKKTRREGGGREESQSVFGDYTHHP
jgi:hypothetical protein